MVKKFFVFNIFTIFLLIIMKSYLFSFQIQNYGQWRNLSLISKNVYISGMIDTYLFRKCENCDFIAFDFLSVCLSDLYLDSNKVVYLLDQYYKNNNNWKYSPQDYFHFEIIDGYCINYKKSFLENYEK